MQHSREDVRLWRASFDNLFLDLDMSFIQSQPQILYVVVNIELVLFSIIYTNIAYIVSHKCKTMSQHSLKPVIIWLVKDAHSGPLESRYIVSFPVPLFQAPRIPSSSTLIAIQLMSLNVLKLHAFSHTHSLAFRTSYSADDYSDSEVEESMTKQRANGSSLVRVKIVPLISIHCPD